MTNVEREGSLAELKFRKLGYTTYVGFITSWAFATTLASADIVMRYLYKWRLFPFTGHFVYIEAPLYYLGAGLAMGLFQWVILAIYLENDIFFPSAKSFSPPLYWWIIATVIGYITRLIIPTFVFNWLSSVFLQNQLMLRFVPNILEQILLSACQWAILQKWVGKKANIWFIPTIFATVIGGWFSFVLGGDITSGNLIAGCIIGFGMLLIVK